MGRIAKIYALTDPRSGVIRYVGKSNDPNKRFRSHVKTTDTSTRKGAWLTALRKAGIKPLLSILETCDKRSWEEAERFWIAHFRVTLYNIDAGGLGGDRVAESTKKKLSALARARGPLSESVKLKISQNGIGSQKVDTAYRERRRQKTLAAWRDPEKRARLLLRNKARWLDPAQKEKHRQKHLGAKRSEETRRKISEAAKRRDPITRIPTEATRQKLRIAAQRREARKREKQIAGNCVKLSVPLKAEAEKGPNWGNLG